MEPVEKENIAHFLFEVERLRDMPRTGWQLIGVKDPENVAEHTASAAQFGLVIAAEEGADPFRVAAMLIIHDNGEVRIGDFNSVVRRYIKSKDKIEAKAFRDQINGLRPKTQRLYLDLFQEYGEGKTLDAIVARDADMLQMAFEAKKLVETGYKTAEMWIRFVDDNLQTETAKNIFLAMDHMSYTDWFRNIIRR